MVSQSAQQIFHDTSKQYTPASGLSTVTDLTNLPCPLGTVMAKVTGGVVKKYKFVMVKDLALLAGDFVCYTTDDNRQYVTSDRAGGTSDNGQPAGIALAAAAVGKCIWIQIQGPNDVAMLTDGNIVAGNASIPHATGDGSIGLGDFAQASGSTKPTEVCGYAVDADTSTAQPIGKFILMCPES